MFCYLQIHDISNDMQYFPSGTIAVTFFSQPPQYNMFLNLMEAFRRGVWNIFRVESEVVNNAGKFRALNLPLMKTNRALTPIFKGQDHESQCSLDSFTLGKFS